MTSGIATTFTTDASHSTWYLRKGPVLGLGKDEIS